MKIRSKIYLNLFTFLTMIITLFGLFTVNVRANSLESISLFVPSVTITELNKSLGSVYVEARYSNGEKANVTTQATVTSSNTNVVYVAAGNSIYSGSSSGQATLTAFYNGKTSSVVVTVTSSSGGTGAGVDIVLDKSTLDLSVGQASYISATILPVGSTNTQVMWTSSNPNVAVVSNGLVTAAAQGSSVISAALPGQSKTVVCYVTVSGQSQQTKTLTAISVNNKSVNIIGLNKSAGGIRVTASYSDNSKKTITKGITYTSSNSNTVFVKGNTLYSGTASGTAVVTVSYTENGIVKTDFITVNVSLPILSSITMSPSTAKINATNKEFTSIRINAKYNNNSSKTVTSSAVFTSSNSNVAYVLNNKLYSGNTTGTAVITATYAENGIVKTANCEVTVYVPILSDLKISQTVINSKELNKQYGSMRVTAKYSDNTSKNVSTSVVFSSSNPSIAYVRDGKLFSGSSQGTTTITAMYFEGGVIKTATLTVNVNIPTLVSIKVSPNSAEFNQLNKAVKSISVTAQYSDKSSKNVTGSCVFTSSNSSVAYVKDKKIYSSSIAGVATIIATYTENGIVQTAYVNVTVGEAQGNTLTLLQVNPSSVTIEGLNRSYGNITVTAVYGNGTTKDVSGTATFTSTNPSVANVINRALYSGSMQGTATINALYSENGKAVTANCTVNVTNYGYGSSLSGLSVNPSYAVINGLNKSYGNIVVNALYSNGTSRDVTSQAIFSSTNSSVANVIGGMLFSGYVQGTNTITAGYSENGVYKTTVITVNVSNTYSNVSYISLNTSSAAINGLNTSFGALLVTAHNSDGTARDVTSSATFSSGNINIANVVNGILYSGSTSGTTTITVSYNENGNIKTAVCSVVVTSGVQQEIRGTIEINLENGREKQYANKSPLILTLNAYGSTPITKMYISTNNTVPSVSARGWETFKNSKTYSYTGKDGIVTLYAWFMDSSNNISKVSSDYIIFDKAPPTGSLKINFGAQTTYAPVVTLELTKSYTYANVKEIIVSNKSDFSSSRSFDYTETIYGWELDSSTVGNKTVYAKYVDWAGNTSKTFSDTIKYSR